MKAEIIDKVFPEKLFTLKELEKKYPSRELSEGVQVVRFAPSPTGFLHIGSLLMALLCRRVASQSNGVFFLRIEDTDKKREVAGAEGLILEALKHYDIEPDEGIFEKGEKGNYGPYKQSERVKIYKTYAKYLMEKGLAYPCFCTHEELTKIRDAQKKQGLRPGCYGQWARHRNLSEEEILKNLKEKKPFVIRYKSPGDPTKRIEIKDIIKGKVSFPQYNDDVVLLKSDGIPTYHFAHIVDDHLMGTTIVIRSDEWLPSLPLHVQMFRSMEWKSPKYAHVAPIQKLDGSSRRKLSKRKDPEANIMFYIDQGYPKDAIIEYLLNLANSNFEDWRRQNPDKSNTEFVLDIYRMKKNSGALLDFDKLDNVSKNIIARMSSKEVFDKGFEWAQKYDPDLAKVMFQNTEYFKSIIGIERDNVKKVRKDLVKWSDLKESTEYFFDEKFSVTRKDVLTELPNLKLGDVHLIVEDFLRVYDEGDTKEQWFEKLKGIAKKHGFAESRKLMKETPEKYKGDITDVVNIFRVLVTGKKQSPDLCAIMKVMGRSRALDRLKE